MRMERMSKEGLPLGRWVLDIMAGNAIKFNGPISQYYLSALKRTGKATKAEVLA